MLVDNFLSEQDLPADKAHACPYLPQHSAVNEGFVVETLDPEIYHALMDRGFRRSGDVIYRPRCPSCSACSAMRIAVHSFQRTRSQRRVWRLNQDVTVRIDDAPSANEEKWRMFRRYLDHQHDTAMPSEYEDFSRFLYNSPTQTLEFTYLLGGTTIGIGIADRSPLSISSVYMFFDPAFADRSPGTFSALWEIEHCRTSGIPYYYLGYYIPEAKTMAYKAKFKPYELLDNSFAWRGASSDPR